jgi:hypothetical protein
MIRHEKDNYEDNARRSTRYVEDNLGKVLGGDYEQLVTSEFERLHSLGEELYHFFKYGDEEVKERIDGYVSKLSSVSHTVKLIGEGLIVSKIATLENLAFLEGELGGLELSKKLMEE